MTAIISPWEDIFGICPTRAFSWTYRGDMGMAWTYPRHVSISTCGLDIYCQSTTIAAEAAQPFLSSSEDSALVS